MEILSHLVQEILSDCIQIVQHSLSLGFISQSLNHIVIILFGEEIEDPSRIQHIIDGNQKDFLLDLGVSQNVTSASRTGFSHFLVYFL